MTSRVDFPKVINRLSALNGYEMLHPVEITMNPRLFLTANLPNVQRRLLHVLHALISRELCINFGLPSNPCNAMVNKLHVEAKTNRKKMIMGRLFPAS
jgi:hypothetical protein